MSRKDSSNSVRSALHETLIILGAWTIGCVWVIGYCALQVYTHHDGADSASRILFGFPEWVVWAIAVPWIVSNVFTIWFCAFHMRQDDDAGGDGG